MKKTTRVRTGMRRPSWNKSQAIQQVISLKALLEPTDDDIPATVGVGVSSAIHHHHHHHPPQPPPKALDPEDTALELQKSTSPVSERPPETNDANVVNPPGSVLHFSLMLFFFVYFVYFFVLATSFVCLFVIFVSWAMKH